MKFVVRWLIAFIQNSQFVSTINQESRIQLGVFNCVSKWNSGIMKYWQSTVHCSTDGDKSWILHSASKLKCFVYYLLCTALYFRQEQDVRQKWKSWNVLHNIALDKVRYNFVREIKVRLLSYGANVTFSIVFTLDSIIHRNQWSLTTENHWKH